jgi:hypothetical protein
MYRTVLVAAVWFAAALMAVVQPKQADAQSRVAATAVHSCNALAAHGNSGLRGLSSARASKVHNVCRSVHRHISKLNFWYGKKHRWTLYLNQSGKKCWELHLQGPLALCLKAREQVRRSTSKLIHINARLESLLPQLLLVHDQLYDTFICIHGGEGSWTANTGNGFYGGLQMNWDFMRGYGADFLARWGTADRWPPWAQILAAKRAYQAGRGFGPWPNTAPPCISRGT